MLSKSDDCSDDNACNSQAAISVEEILSKFSQCAAQFEDACLQNDAKLAQELAMGGLAVIANLFPHPNNPAHLLLLSMLGMIMDAQVGRSKSKLSRSTYPMQGVKQGFGHANLGGFALSAFNLLKERNQTSDFKNRKLVAGLLTELECSLRKGDHEQPKSVTESAIRNWQNKERYPLQNEIADDLAKIHEINLELRNANTLDEILKYLRQHGELAVRLQALY